MKFLPDLGETSLFFISSPKKMTEAQRMAIKNVFVTLGDKAWLQKDRRYYMSS